MELRFRFQFLDSFFKKALVGLDFEHLHVEDFDLLVKAAKAAVQIPAHGIHIFANGREL
jgi:hypothetical protein